MYNKNNDIIAREGLPDADRFPYAYISAANRVKND